MKEKLLPNQFFMVQSHGFDLLDEDLNKLRTIVQEFCQEETDEILRMIPERLDQSTNFYGRYTQNQTKSTFSKGELLKALQYEEPSSTARYLRYRYRFANYPTRFKICSYPLVVIIEPTSVCNLKCQFCFISDPRLSKNREINGFMSMETFVRIADEAGSQQLDSMVFTGRGEPTLNKNIGKMICYARASGILDIKLNTNALVLNDPLIHEILDGDPDVVVFSVDDASPEVYNDLRRGSDYARVFQNIQRFTSILKREYPKNRTLTRVSMVVCDANQDIEKAKRLWEPIVDEFAHKGAHERLNIYDKTTIENSTPCSLLFERVYIWWDGTVNPCDNDYLSVLKKGKIDEQTSLSQIWCSPSFQLLREIHRSGQKANQPICSVCEGR